MNRTLLLVFSCTAALACANEGADTETDDSGSTTEVASAPLELSHELCDDPSNMAVLLESPIWSGLLASGAFNEEQVQRMSEAPTTGPFYMVNLIRYREWAVYADGRETDLSGREANALYSPVEFLEAIGARVVLSAEVDTQIDGDEFIWETVAIVEYPCPVAFFAMLSDPAFQERVAHKDAGVEKSIVMVTELVPGLAPDDPDQSEAQYPPTAEDPVFELIHVMDFHDIAQYEPGSGEPERTGQEAWSLYQAAEEEASAALGHYSAGRFTVQGVLAGDERRWDEIEIVRMSSQAGFQALLEDPTREAATYHRVAALARNYSMITFPTVSQLPSGDDEPQGVPVTPDGTGTSCEVDADCPGGGVDTCITGGQGPGFCTREGCGAGECQSPYLCCHDCAAEAASMLPFDGSACVPDSAAGFLTEAPISCTCD